MLLILTVFQQFSDKDYTAADIRICSRPAELWRGNKKSIFKNCYRSVALSSWPGVVTLFKYTGDPADMSAMFDDFWNEE